MPDFKQNIPPYGRAEKQGVPQLQTKFKRHFLKQNVYVILHMLHILHNLSAGARARARVFFQDGVVAGSKKSNRNNKKSTETPSNL